MTELDGRSCHMESKCAALRDILQERLLQVHTGEADSVSSAACRRHSLAGCKKGLPPFGAQEEIRTNGPLEVADRDSWQSHRGSKACGSTRLESSASSSGGAISWCALLQGAPPDSPQAHWGQKRPPSRLPVA